MAMGLGYDSDGGRAMAAAITSLMTGTSYKRSAELAAVVGPYNGYARNADAHKRVMRKHQAANDAVRTIHSGDRDVHKLAAAAWDQVVKLGEKNGYRNAQASVLAPTGTIGFMMDCDTTGIEPDFSLVKFKKLVGGGSMQIVNQTVPRALRKLGYQEEQVEAIVEYIAEHGHVIDAPGLKTEHYEVFDCAMGERSLAPMGHVRMMAAAQPFLSGAISKTVNLPETATVEDIEDVYLQSWKLGLKATAIYRDNCKVGQPLADAEGEGRRHGGRRRRRGRRAGRRGIHKPFRKRLPKSRASRTTSFTVGGAEGYMTSGAHEDGELGEIFLKLGKQGSTLAGVMDAFSIAVSIGLQYGVPLETYVSKFTNLRFEPAGLTDDPDVRMAQSIMDYIFRRLALDYLPFDDRSMLGIYSAEERQRQLETGSYEPVEEVASRREAESLRDASPRWLRRPSEASRRRNQPRRRSTEVVEVPKNVHTCAELMEAITGTAVDSPLCFTCGTKMRPAGSCYVCEGCGSTSGCSSERVQPPGRRSGSVGQPRSPVERTVNARVTDGFSSGPGRFRSCGRNVHMSRVITDSVSRSRRFICRDQNCSDPVRPDLRADTNGRLFHGSSGDASPSVIQRHTAAVIGDAFRRDRESFVSLRSATEYDRIRNQLSTSPGRCRARDLFAEWLPGSTPDHSGRFRIFRMLPTLRCTGYQ